MTAYVKTIARSARQSMKNRNQLIDELVRSARKEINSAFLDEHGLIIQRDKDGGDCLNRIPIAHCLLHWLGYYESFRGESTPVSYIKSMNALEPEFGKWVRYAYPEKPEDFWMKDPHTTSRDQLSPLPWGAIPFSDSRRTIRLVKVLLRRGGFYPNSRRFGSGYEQGQWKVPDIISPTHIADFIRALRAWYLYPLLWVLDLGLIVNALLRIGKDAINDSGSNDVNGYMHIAFSMRHYPTPIAWLARKIYFSSNPISRIKHYFRPSSNAPPIWKLYYAYHLACGFDEPGILTVSDGYETT